MTMKSLDDVRVGTLGWLRRAELEGGCYRFSFDRDAKPALYSTLYAVFALELFDALGRSDRREELVSAIRRHQDPETGFFRDPNISYVRGAPHNLEHTTWHMSSCALQALDALSARPEHPLHYLDGFRSREQIRSWLASLNLRAAWRDSNKIMALLGSLFFNYDWTGDPEWLARYSEVLDWLDEVQDPSTGLWGPTYGSGLLNGMAAAYHFLMFYFAAGRPVPHMERIIDSTLSLQASEGNFLPFGGSSCIDLDAIEILISLSRFTDHRLEEIRSAARRLYVAIAESQNDDGGFGEHSTGRFGRRDLLHLALSFSRHRCAKSYQFQTRQLVKHTLLRRRRMYSGSIEQCSSGMYVSNIWCAWFRPLAMAVVAERFPMDYPASRTFRPNYRRLPGLGYTAARTPAAER